MATSAMPLSSSYHGLGIMISSKLGGMSTILQDVHGIFKTKKHLYWPTLRFKANAKLPPKMMMVNQNISHTNCDQFGLGGEVDDRFVSRQTFYIRSYEIGPDRKASIETIMNILQESIINHAKSIGVLGDGFGPSLEMGKNLVWVMTRMQIEVDRYPIWGDIIQVDAYLSALGKKDGRYNLLIRDCKTCEILIRASSNMAMMNNSTRRLSRFSNEIQAKLDQYLVDRPSILVEDTRKLPKLDESIVDHVYSGLKPRWSDFDVNEHVNNVKYIGWIVESVPESIMKNYELASMILEYHRECGKDCMLQSLTSIIRNDNDGITYNVDCHHMLQFEDGGRGVIMKGWTTWRPKQLKTHN